MDGDLASGTKVKPGSELSPYAGAQIFLVTKHSKALAIATPFRAHLLAIVEELLLDTDTLGTFSGEVERDGNALECARRKCEWGRNTRDADYFLSSEGSFGPHPWIPFLPWDQEILYFRDYKRGFDLHLVHGSEKTNYQMQAVQAYDELEVFAESAKFPSHSLIIRPNEQAGFEMLFKGIRDHGSLKHAYVESLKHSKDGKVWAETDMRADQNPSRMAVIAELAAKTAQRLAASCPSCGCPGWGEVKVSYGLPCEYCDRPSEMVAQHILGCPLCNHQLLLPRSDGLVTAPEVNCGWCNP